MKATCAYSGIAFSCEHFPATVTSSELVHPIFYLKPAKLLSYISNWADGSLNETDSYLLFLALLSSTEQVVWRLPVERTAKTNQLVANNMEKLASLSVSILQLKNRKEILPAFTISADSRSLDNVSDWLLVWEQALVDYKTGYRSTNQLQKQRDAESYLERVIKDNTRDARSYSKLLANWADLAGNFPRFLTLTPSGSKVPLNMYWKELIVKACLEDSIFTISQSDLDELIEHCEQEIPHGSIYAHRLMKILKTAAKSQRDFFGNLDTSFVVLSPDTSVEDANKVALMATAPSEPPSRGQYATLAGYLKAKIAYDMVQKYHPTVATTSTQGEDDASI